MEEIIEIKNDNLNNHQSNDLLLTSKTEEIVIEEVSSEGDKIKVDEEQIDETIIITESKLLKVDDNNKIPDESNMSFIESLTNVKETQNDETRDLISTRNVGGGNEFLSSSNESSTTTGTTGTSSSSSTTTTEVKNPNSFTLVSELSSPKINAEQNQRNWQAISSSNESSSSSSASSSSEAIYSPNTMFSPPSPPDDKISHLVLSPPSDELNPKKNSPVPTTLSSSTNNIYIDTQLDRSSIDHSSTVQSQQQQQQNIHKSATTSQTSLLGRAESAYRDNNNNENDNMNLKVNTTTNNTSSGPSSKQSVGGGEKNSNSTSPWSSSSSSKPCLHYHHNLSHQNQSSEPTTTTTTTTTTMNKSVKIASCMDKWYKEMKGQVLSQVSKEVEILKEHQKKLIEEKDRQNSEINRLRLEIEFQKETIKMYERYQLKKDETIEQLKKDIEKQCDRNQVLRDMMEWKLKRVEDSKEMFTLKIAENFYNYRLKQKWFFCWKLAMLEKNKSNMEKLCKKKAEEVCLDIATRYENKIKKLEEERLKVDDELRLSRMENERFRVELAKSEENMRKALMRGVCALNLEAMSIFNENIPQFEPPPPPTTTTHNTTSAPATTTTTTTTTSVKTSKKGKNHSDKDRDDLLARKVRQFCEVRFDAQTTATDKTQPQLSAEFIRSKAAAMASKLATRQQLSSKSNENLLKSVAESPNKPKIHSNNKIFDELVEHSLNIHQTKPLAKSTNIRSKINSIATSSSTKSNRTANTTGAKSNPSSKYVHLEQKILIEKHSSTENNDNTTTTATNDLRFVTPLTSFK